MATKSLSYYYRKVMDYCAHWKELGVLLDVKTSQLNVIEKDKLKDSNECMIAMLDAWLKRHPRNPEKKLEDALRLQQNDHEKLLKVGLEMEENIQQLKTDFADIVVRACKWLRNRYPNAEDAAVWLNEALRGLQSEPLVVQGRVSDHSALLKKLQEKWSFTNRTFLQQLIEKTKKRTLIIKMKKYEEGFKKVCNSITISNKAIQKEMILETYDESKSCLVIVITSTLHLDDIKAFLIEVFGVHERYLRIHKIASGCVQVSLQFEACMKPYLQGCVDEKCEEVKHYAKMYIEKDQAETPEAQPEAVSSKDPQKKRIQPTKAKTCVKMQPCRYTAQSKLGKHPHITDDTSKGYSLRKKAKRDMQ